MLPGARFRPVGPFDTRVLPLRRMIGIDAAQGLGSRVLWDLGTRRNEEFLGYPNQEGMMVMRIV